MAVHTVKQGDTLSGIASQYRVKHWQDIYLARENDSLRQARGLPSNIRPGDKVIVPKVIDTTIRDRERRRLIELIRRLNADKVEIERLFNTLRDENAKAARTMKNWATGVDVAASVLMLGKGLYDISAKAAASMKLSGDALKEANKAFYVDFLKSRTESMRDLAAQAADAAIQEPDSFALMVGKSVAVAIGSITAPSFWAAAWNDQQILRAVKERNLGHLKWDPTQWNPDAIAAKAQTELAAARRSALATVDAHIAKYNQAVAALR